MTKKVLIVDDEKEIVETLVTVLKSDYEVRGALSVDSALGLVQGWSPDIIISDLNMPGEDGMSFCRRIRGMQNLAHVPFIFLTGRNDENSRILCFDMGADDFIAKPVSTRELRARIDARLRASAPRAAAATETKKVAQLVCGNVTIDHKRGSVSLKGKAVDLTSFEIKLLTFFIENQNRKLRRDDILMDVWAPHMVSGRTVDAHICALRQKLEGFDHKFETIRGVGYQLVPVSSELLAAVY